MRSRSAGGVLKTLSSSYPALTVGEQAVLEYSRLEDDGPALDLYHTEVPPSQRGKGLGGVLAEVSRDYHMITT